MTVIKNDVINEYTNSGSDRYSITFEYDRPEQVTVRTYNSDTNEYEDVTDCVFDGATAIRFTGVVPDTFEIVRVTNISQSYGESRYAVFQQGSAIKAGDLNGNLELLRLAIEEGANELDGQQDQINDLNDEIDRLDGRIDQEIIDRENGDQNLQDQIDDIETNIDQIEAGSLDGRYVNVTGDTMTGALSMSDNKIDTLSDPSSPQDAVNLCTLQTYLDTEIGDLDPNKSPSYVRFTFTASGGETVVTVPAYVTGGELVFINGAEQTRNVDYTPTNSTTITFDQALLAGDVFDLYCVNTLKVIELPLGDTSNLPVIRQTFTATNGQTTFTLTGGEQYTPGKEQVFLNGNLLERDTDYTGNVGTSFVLEQGALAGDQVEIFCVNYTVDGPANTASNVSYTYPGGVQRTVQNRLEEYVSVKDFGAVGDGSDATDAFRKALAAAPAVYVPPGQYVISSTIELHGKRLFGSTPQSVKFTSGNLSGTYTLIRYTGSGSCFKVVDNATFINYGNVEISNLTIRNYSASSQVTGIEIGTDANAAIQTTVRDCVIQGFYQGIYVNKSWNVYLTDIHVWGNNRNSDNVTYDDSFGIVLSGVGRPTTSNYLTRCQVSSTSCGFLVNTDVFYSSLNQCYADACNVGLWARDIRYRALTLVDFACENSRNMAIYCDRARVDIFGFSWLKNNTTAQHVVNVFNDSDVCITGGDNIDSGSYGNLSAFNVSSGCSLMIRDINFNPLTANAIAGTGTWAYESSGDVVRNNIQQQPSANVTIGFSNRNSTFRPYKQNLWQCDGGASQPINGSPTFLTVADGELFTITNAGSTGDLSIRTNDISGSENCGVVKNSTNTSGSGVVIKPKHSATFLISNNLVYQQ